MAALAAYLAGKTAQAAGGEADAAGQSGDDGWLSDGGSSVGSLALADASPQLRLVGASEVVVRSSGDALLRPEPSDQARPIPVERWDVEGQAELVGGLPVQVRWARG